MPFFKNKEFYPKIFTDNEIKYCLKYKDPYTHFAGRFALKEATVKAIHIGMSLKEIEILQGTSNEPKICLNFENMIFESSLSYEKEIAIGVVIAIKSNL